MSSNTVRVRMYTMKRNTMCT